MTRGNSREKKAVRARMAVTGENYTTALRRHREERAAAQEQRDAAAEVAEIADHLIRHWMSDLETDERPRDLETLAERLKACAGDFREISGSF